MDKKKKDDELTGTPSKTNHGENSPYEATREVVWRHLTNKDDVITDDDIKNAYTGEPVKDTVEDEKLVKSRAKDLERSRDEDEERDKDKDGFDDQDNREPITPSTVLDS